jgi:hypothetical protein
MLLPDNIHPENSLYYNSSFVLSELQKNRSQSLLDLYQNVKNIKDISISVFILCLDWLFLIEVVKLNNKNEVSICS